MLKYYEYINEAMKKVNYPFIQAAIRGNNNKIKELIKTGIDINRQGLDTDGKTALMNAVIKSFISVVNTLVDAGANVNLQDKCGSTALMMARTNKIINKLLDAGANVNIQNKEGNTALMLYLGYSENIILSILDKFIEKGLDLNIKDNKGDTFYDMIKNFSAARKEFSAAKKDITNLLNIEKYINEKFPEIKEEWELKNDIDKYNL